MGTDSVLELQILALLHWLHFTALDTRYLCLQGFSSLFPSRNRLQHHVQKSSRSIELTINLNDDGLCELNSPGSATCTNLIHQRWYNQFSASVSFRRSLVTAQVADTRSSGTIWLTLIRKQWRWYSQLTSHPVSLPSAGDFLMRNSQMFRICCVWTVGWEYLSG